MPHTPTPEQQAVIDAAVNSKDNLIVSALAGAAKTSTLVMVAGALKDTNILCLAFNKRIAVEMQERLPPNCKAMTLNSLGHRTWAEVISRRLTLETNKTFKILTELIQKLGKREQEEAYADFADTMKAIDFGKACGYIPSKHFENAKALMRDDDFFGHLEEEPSLIQEMLIRNASLISIQRGMEGVIDFGDQILLPTVFPCMFEFFPLVMVDEAQDLSALNHATLRKLAKRRLIAVGDENQAIYGFRGAHEDSMPFLAETFKMRKLMLSVSFRCPSSVVAEAQWRAPHMRFPEWAKEGKVSRLVEWDVQSLPPQAAIICRNNAPLFSMAIKLLKNGRYPQIIGNDIGKYLLKVMKKFGKNDLPRAEAMIALSDWVAEKLKKSRSPTKVHDQEACIRVFLEQGETLGDALAYAEHIFASQGPIQLMTGHKSKGLEFDDVFFLDEHLINMEEPQDRNLKYVIQTRAKVNLTYVNSEDFFDAKADE